MLTLLRLKRRQREIHFAEFGDDFSNGPSQGQNNLIVVRVLSVPCQCNAPTTFSMPVESKQIRFLQWHCCNVDKHGLDGMKVNQPVVPAFCVAETKDRSDA